MLLPKLRFVIQLQSYSLNICLRQLSFKPPRENMERLSLLPFCGLSQPSFGACLKQHLKKSPSCSQT